MKTLPSNNLTKWLCQVQQITWWSGLMYLHFCLLQIKNKKLLWFSFYPFECPHSVHYLTMVVLLPNLLSSISTSFPGLPILSLSCLRMQKYASMAKFYYGMITTDLNFSGYELAPYIINQVMLILQPAPIANWQPKTTIFLYQEFSYCKASCFTAVFSVEYLQQVSLFQLYKSHIYHVH